MQDQALRMAKSLHLLQNTGSVMQLARSHGVEQFGDQLFPHVGQPELSGPFGRRPLLQSPIRDLHKATPGRIAGISPAEAQIEKIFERIPAGAAFRARRVHVEAAQMTIGAADPAWRQQVDLKPAQMRVCRGKYRWAEPWRNARESNF